MMRRLIRRPVGARQACPFRAVTAVCKPRILAVRLTAVTVDCLANQVSDYLPRQSLVQPYCCSSLFLLGTAGAGQGRPCGGWEQGVFNETWAASVAAGAGRACLIGFQDPATTFWWGSVAAPCRLTQIGNK